MAKGQLIVTRVLITTMAVFVASIFPWQDQHPQSGTTYAEAKGATGSLTVKIKPKDAKKDGARWRVDGGAWQKSGKAVDNLSEGMHTLSFLGIIGWKGPAVKVVTIQANKETKQTGKYKVPPNSIVLPNDVVLELVAISGGSYMMGRYTNEQDSIYWEGPQHQVTLGGFAIGKYEVTKAQWQALMNTTPWTSLQNYIADPNSPAVNVSWDDAHDFIDALNAHVVKTQQGAGTFNLPSESQWEYACRAGTFTRFYWSDDASYTGIDSYAWWDGNASSANQRYAHVVGMKVPNLRGLYDMSGNVAEWCEDDFDYQDYTGAPADGSAWILEDASLKVYRGGNWASDGDECRSAARGGYTPEGGFDTVGFRIVR